MTGIGSMGGMSASGMRNFQPPSFSKLDEDSSGGISLEEMQASAPQGADETEIASRTQELFSEMDSDGDGQISSDEKDSFDSQMQQRMQEMQFAAQLMSSQGGAPAGPPPGPPPSLDDASSDIISQLDTDGDGSLSEAELAGSDAMEGIDEEALSELFSSMDSDESGAISQDELASFLEENKPNGPPPGPPQGGVGGPPPPPPEDGEVSASSDSEETQSSLEDVSLDMLSAAIDAYTSLGSSTSSESLIDSLLEAA